MNKLFSLSEQEKKILLLIARKTIENFLLNSKKFTVEEQNLTENLKSKCGAFVTLHKKGELGGCIGRFGEIQPLHLVIQEMAIAAATEDTRFEPVDILELNEIDIEISVLTPKIRIYSPAEMENGKHGIYIKKGWNNGTLLPQVAIEHNLDKYEFLKICSKNKAGIGEDGWKTAELYVYEAIVFGEKKYKN